jgi:hypothetical protein
MASVFISSTKADLLEYRQGVIDVCDRLGLHHLTMEHFEAEGADGATGSKRQLEKANVYIGIFARRYGQVTEIEYDYAGELGIERLCFIVDQEYSWPIGQVDIKNHDALENFLKKVSTETIRNKFTTVNDLKVKTMHALVKWMERHQVSQTSLEGDHRVLSQRVIPVRPDLVVGRESDVAKLKSRFGILHSDTKYDLTIIRGWPGVGKTTLINSLIHDQEVNDLFKDGILWAVMGEKGNAFSELVSWGRQLGIHDMMKATSLQEVIAQLQSAIRDRNMLLVVDDVWDEHDVIPFKQVRGNKCHLIISTRFPGIARQVAIRPEQDIYLLDVLDDDKGFDLFSQLAPSVARQYPSQIKTLIRDIEGLPLAIRVAGRLLDEEYALGVDITPLMIDIRENRRLLGEKAPDDRFDPKTGTTPTINFLIQQSTSRLDEKYRRYYIILGAFAPKPATFDLAAMEFMWQITDSSLSLSIIRILVNRGLLEPIPTINRFQMHAVLAMHAQSLLE